MKKAADPMARAVSDVLRAWNRCNEEVAAWEKSSGSLSMATRLAVTKRELNRFLCAFEESAFLKRAEHEREKSDKTGEAPSTVYFVIAISLPTLLKLKREAGYADTEAVNRLIDKIVITVPRLVFDEIVLAKESQHAPQYRDFLKSVDRHAPPATVGVVDVLMGKDKFCGTFFATRRPENVRGWTRADFARMFEHQYPRDGPPTEELLDSLMKMIHPSSLIEEGEVQYRLGGVFCPNAANPSREFMRKAAKLSRTCSRCQRRGINLSTCAVCKAAWYCDIECQRAHWKPAHRAQCKFLAAAVALIEQEEE